MYFKMDKKPFLLYNITVAISINTHRLIQRNKNITFNYFDTKARLSLITTIL